jgi:putative cell wall-binding protein
MTPPRHLARVAALAATALLATTGVAAADIPDDSALPDDAVAAQRYAGGDRYATAARTALEAFPDGADVAIIARGDTFPDGLAASYLAGVEDAPILLTQSNRLPLITQDAFGPLGIQRVVIVGGTGAISQGVEDRLVEEFGEGGVDRIGGGDRFQTAAFLFNQTGAIGQLDDVSGDSTRRLSTAVVASGRNFPDALAAGPMAHAAGLPILLTERGSLPAITRFALESGVEQVLVAGGSATVSSSVVAAIRGIDGVDVVERVSGPDRTATAAAFARLTRDQLGWPAEAAAVSLGIDFPDALSLAPAASRMQAPILLTRSRSEAGAATFADLQSTCETLTTLVVSGGSVAIDATAERQLELGTSCADHTFPLAADAVVDGGGDTDGRGTGWLWTESLCHAVRVRDLGSEATAVELRRGAPDETGQLVAELGAPSPATGDGLSAGCLTDDEIRGGSADELRAALQEQPGDFHVLVRTEDHPDGALRGQVADPGA